MRQRNPRGPPREEGSSRGSKVWGASSSHKERDGGTPQPVPMYNPMQYSASNIPAPPGSFPLQYSYNQYNDPFYQGQLKPAPSSFSGLSNQLPPLSPSIIPDSHYQAYRNGYPIQKRKQKALVTRVCMAQFCGIFSIVAVLFLVFVGILIDTQPLYLPGVLPKHELYTSGSSKKQVFYTLPTTDRLTPARHAYSAAFLYLVTAVLCLAYAYNAPHWFKSRVRQYEDIPDSDSTVPTFHQSAREGDLPTTVPQSPGRSAYRYNQHLGITRKVWEIAMVTYNRVRLYVISTLLVSQEHRARRREAGPKDV